MGHRLGLGHERRRRGPQGLMGCTMSAGRWGGREVGTGEVGRWGTRRTGDGAALAEQWMLGLAALSARSDECGSSRIDIRPGIYIFLPMLVFGF